jgi:ribosomal-protein-alanine N-acetyltransferase
MLLPNLIGAHIHLRSLKRSDIAALAKQANDPSIARFMPSLPHPYTSEHARRWVNCVQRAARNDAAYQWGIELVSRHGIIGMMGLKNLNLADRNGELEYWLGQRYRGRSYASEAMKLLLKFAFNDLHLHRIYAIVVSSNLASVRLLEQHGLVREAVWRDASWIDNRWHNVYGYGLLETEFKKFE